MLHRGKPFARRSDRVRRRRRAGFIGGGLLTLLLLMGPEPAADGAETAPKRNELFTSVAAAGTNLAPFRKWQSVLQRYEAERRDAAADRCHPAAPASTACVYVRWTHFLDGLRSTGRRQQLLAVNREVNRRPYVTDRTNWGVDDYWETPGEFLTHSGDCEDYAILKFLSLRQLGWTGEALRIAAVHDTRLNIGHAVVVAEDGGKTWILDNQLPDVVEAASVGHYQPVYSLTETSWRLHRSPEQSTASPGQGDADASDQPAVAIR